MQTYVFLDFSVDLTMKVSLLRSVRSHFTGNVTDKVAVTVTASLQT